MTSVRPRRRLRAAGLLAITVITVALCAPSALASQPTAPPGISPADWRNQAIYRQIYFAAYPAAWGKVEVHHAIEQQVLKRYPGLYTEAWINDLPNLRGIPLIKGQDGNNTLHRSLIRLCWDYFYELFPGVDPKTGVDSGKHPTKYHIEAWARALDLIFSNAFWSQEGRANPAVGHLPDAARMKATIDGALALAAEYGNAQLVAQNPMLKKMLKEASVYLWAHVLFEDARTKLAPEERRTVGDGSQTKAMLARQNLGGVDFSSVELRYLSDRPSGDGRSVGLSYRAGSLPLAGEGMANGLAAMKESSDAFFVWLSLPPSAFTVNLNPDEPNRIVDEKLGQTDAGRILLEADLELKRTAGRLMMPDNPVGERFQARRSPQCFTLRQWIVPAPATVHANGDELYIANAPLAVKMEPSQVNTPMAGSSCPQAKAELTQRDEAAFTELILPLVEKTVNEAPEYAPLRRVYLSRVAAQWYRDRSLSTPTAYGNLIDSGTIDRWKLAGPWKPTDTFNAYVKSFTEGDIRVTRNGRSYVFGGVDFTKVPVRQEVPANWAGLSKTIEQSRQDATVDGGSVWLGTQESAPTGGLAPGGVAAPEQLDGLTQWWRSRLSGWMIIGTLVLLFVAVRLTRRKLSKS
ncbi:hypothetical protein EV193_11174 [Herbihabitans rhizosphaerae]|uniref:Uncharacterized protein n=1 Tax=Herbihabitans rhizosphaerae TaxID=1872711 RepID=A0A4Q7KF11_9PSEU|nr:hypothetical protein [Herbihabitans rhizosphaerae]RZS32691.1 hypothetical protein EV193_11174 [Herbihabitans rhizosphaerae]